MVLPLFARLAALACVLRDVARCRLSPSPSAAAYSSKSPVAKTNVQGRPFLPSSPRYTPGDVSATPPRDKPVGSRPREVRRPSLWLIAAREALHDPDCRRPGCLFSADMSAQYIGGRGYDAARTVRALVIGLVAAVPYYKW